MSTNAAQKGQYKDVSEGTIQDKSVDSYFAETAAPELADAVEALCGFVVTKDYICIKIKIPWRYIKKELHIFWVWLTQ